MLPFLVFDTGWGGSFRGLKSAGGVCFATSLKSSAVVNPAGYGFDATTFRTILRPSLSAIWLWAVTRARVFKFITQATSRVVSAIYLALANGTNKRCHSHWLEQRLPPTTTMGPPRRTPSTCDSYSSQYSLSDASTPPQSPTAHRRQPQPSVSSKQPQRHTGMSPASRYNHNLKVLRRRDPSIASIFDQFSHVCLYHHNGNKWEKQGFEGSMFLYER